MIKLDHLQSYELTLITQGLLFVGSGKKIPKKEYLLDVRKGTVSFLNEQAFFDLLVQYKLVDLFESYCMRSDDNLYNFIYKECRLTNEQVKPAILYEVSAGNALDGQHSLKEINGLMRNAKQEAYIPGSSLKGAIRTAILFDMIQRENSAGHSLEARKLPEENYLHTLDINKNKPTDAVNSIMRGIQISDSEPITNQRLTLSMKTDSNVDGDTHTINLCRECVAPGTSIKFRLTLDQSVLKNTITILSIMNALRAFYSYQQRTYAGKFSSPVGSIKVSGQCLMTFGGGAGFFTKSLAYPYLGEKNGLQWTATQLQQSFRSHHHDGDPQNFGISPRTMKYAQYQGKLYSFGTCEVVIR